MTQKETLAMLRELSHRFLVDASCEPQGRVRQAYQVCSARLDVVTARIEELGRKELYG